MPIQSTQNVLLSFFRIGSHSTFVLYTALPMLSGFSDHLTGAHHFSMWKG